MNKEAQYRNITQLIEEKDSESPAESPSTLDVVKNINLGESPPSSGVFVDDGSSFNWIDLWIDIWSSWLWKFLIL